MMKNLLKFLMIIFCFSCKKVKVEDKIPYTVYTISDHKSTYDIERVNSHRIEGVAKFSSSCEYELTENIGQINKLIGLSSGINHHENSMRIGWEYADGVFKLFAYWYVDGTRGESYLTSVVTDEKFEFVVEVKKDEFYVNINGVEFQQEHNMDSLGESFLLFPYFGGKAKFPGSVHGDKKCEIYIHMF